MWEALLAQYVDSIEWVLQVLSVHQFCCDFVVVVVVVVVVAAAAAACCSSPVVVALSVEYRTCEREVVGLSLS